MFNFSSRLIKVVCVVISIGAAGLAALWIELPSADIAASDRASSELSEISEAPAVAYPRGAVRQVTSTASAENFSDNLSLVLFNAINDTARPAALDLWSSGKKGGQFYAAKLVAQCALLFATGRIVDEDTYNPEVITSSNHAEVSRLHARMKRRCDQFTDDDFARMQLSNVSDSDVLLNAVHRFAAASKTGNHEERFSAISLVLATHDPLVMGEIGVRLVLSRRPDGAGVFYFRGEEYALMDERMLRAFELLPCGLGLDCSTDFETISACAVSGACYASRFERARAEMDASLYEQTITLYQALLKAVRDGDAKAFMRN